MLGQKVLTACALELCLDSDQRKAVCEVSNYGEGEDQRRYRTYSKTTYMQIKCGGTSDNGLSEIRTASIQQTNHVPPWRLQLSTIHPIDCQH